MSHRVNLPPDRGGTGGLDSKSRPQRGFSPGIRTDAKTQATGMAKLRCNTAASPCNAKYLDCTRVTPNSNRDEQELKLPDLSASIQDKETRIARLLSQRKPEEQHTSLTQMYLERRRALLQQEKLNEEPKASSYCEDDMHRCNMCDFLREEVRKCENSQILLEGMSKTAESKNRDDAYLVQEHRDNSKEIEQLSTRDEDDPLMIECVECGGWVAASTQKHNIAIGYCCSNVLVSEIHGISN
mmetsp:Transcript_3594/g.6891  ORF Transcript_3594/g.6891 Transcript_3594/m.6891 type:complete len:241 (+) Transcript_3594:2873-3595(+)